MDGLDVRQINPYLRSVMLRILLTFLALLTGFAGQTATAQVMVPDGCEVESGAIKALPDTAILAAGAFADHQHKAVPNGRLGDRHIVGSDVTYRVLTVLSGIDRARE